MATHIEDVSEPRNQSGPVKPGTTGSNLIKDKSQFASKPRLGPFAIMKTIGEGSFGKVKYAIHTGTGQQVALKFISRQSLKKPDMSSRVDREIAYLKLLRHPHIIKLHDVVTTPTDIIMVIEFAGRELFDYIVQNGRMTEDAARRFFQQIVCAVEYCHRHKIVHRDLKPENLLLDEQLNVKIADFGLSNLMTDGNFLKTSCGSPNYASPEVIGGKLYAGPEVDVWSCGVILYVMLVGRLPFDDEFIPNLFKKISNGVYSLPQWVPAGARSLLKKMLVVDSMQRITIQGIRDDEWFQEKLPEYLRPYNLHADHHNIDPNVVGKLGQAMGFSKDDVYEALAKPESNVIKEAYEIVVENQVLRNDQTLHPAGTEGNVESFLAQSPPSWDPNDITSPRRSPHGIPLMPSQQQAGASTSQGVFSPATAGASGPVDVSSASGGKHKEDVPSSNTIRCLESSLPEAHRHIMREKVAREHKAPQLSLQEQVTSDIGVIQNKLHQSVLDNESSSAASSPTSVSSQTSPTSPTGTHAPPSISSLPVTKKARPPRWHFGIRSRSPPFEVLSEIYRALKALGAEFRQRNTVQNFGVSSTSKDTIESKGPSKPRSRAHSAASRHDSSPSRSRNGTRESLGSHHEYYDSQDASPKSHLSHASRNLADQESRQDKNEPVNDPFFIRCRWTKYDPISKEASENNGEQSESAGSSVPARTGICVYIDIQLYSLDKDCYLVDFKCSGYEPIGATTRVASSASSISSRSIRSTDAIELTRDGGIARLFKNQQSASSRQHPPNIPEIQIPVDTGAQPRRIIPLNAPLFTGREKQVSSAFPFLDVASMLIQSLI